MKRLALLAATALLAAACAVSGPPRNDQNFQRIRQGMTEAEVRSIAGAPDEDMPFRLSRTHSWAWYYHDTFGFYSLFSVTFGPDGLVIGTFVKRLNDGGDKGAN